MNDSPDQLPKLELPDSTERLRLALRAANVGLWDWDLRTNEVYFSPEWKRQIGYEEHEIANDFNEWQSRLHPENLAKTIQAVQAYRAHPAGGYNVEFRFRHKDGSYRWIQADGSVMNDERGQPVRLLGSHLDITARKEAETRLKGSEAQYRRLFEAAKDGILILNAETGMIEDVNPYLTELLGLTREQVLKDKVWELGFFKNLVANREKFEELKRVGYVRYDDLPLEAADGRRIAVEFVSNVYEVNGTKVIQCNIRNITERKRAEEMFRQRAAELERFHRLSVGRELRMIELKQEVNELAGLLGRTPPYDLSKLTLKP